MNLVTSLGLTAGSVISVTGAGGKTTFIFSLAQELRSKYKVLVVTTTKMYVPQKEQFDFIAMEEEENLIVEYCISKEKGIYVFGSLIKDENKLSALGSESLMNICKYFDFILIEADGSKRKPLKGWNEKEPVIISNTTVTVGVLDIQVLGKKINETLIHRLDKFLELTGAFENHPVQIEHLERILFSDKGLFKNSPGEKILLINKVESLENIKSAESLVKHISKNNGERISKIISGSLKNNAFSLEWK